LKLWCNKGEGLSLIVEIGELVMVLSGSGLGSLEKVDLMKPGRYLPLIADMD
jgi:hypothetical protein